MDITLYWKYLRHDIDQWAWRLGEAWKEQGVHRAEAQSDDSEADVNFIRRKIGEAVASLRVLLSERLDDSETASADDTLDTEREEWVFPMRESQRAKASPELAGLAHRYVVWYVVWKWCLIYFPDRARAFGDELAVIAASVEDAAYRRDMPRKFKRRPRRDVDDVDVTVDTDDV